MVSRVDRGAVANWWWTIDRYFLAACLALMGLGVLLSFAASPAVAQRIGLDSFHFVERQTFFMIPAVAVMIGVSFLSPRQIRRFALILLCASLFLMAAALFVGIEIKGARRWVSLAGISIQPSEFMKPAFVVICAWLFSERERGGEMPGYFLAMMLFCVTAGLLMLQPDFGQTMLTTGTWGAMFFLAGLPMFWILVLGGIAVVGAFGAYMTLDHVAGRVNRFMTGEGDTFQVDAGREAILRGGWFGQGPGEGTVKRIIPDSHTDFIFSVAAEEYGIILCMIIMALFAFIVIRGLSIALRERDAFTRLAVSGIVILFGFQSIINMAVNLHLMPAKGMTLPFISYGGSSLVAIAITMGILLALTRRRPEARMTHTVSMGERIPAL
ncbi:MULTISPECIES: putative lipid II flippase FtsW [Brucella]|jgi:cell division protein FtsW|uniref:Probable peptidoglycan glycosyltransferase FtsW n=1 Tax=Brucella pseudogrignonensis TaxID=419475 RepID=A0A1A9FKB1_9HYPH|nr:MULTISPECIES: putative lipid II flippase FtsW [Brucella]EMG54155.1 cell division protein FtsW [Ochrobactrum sp. CDB2]MBK0021393.1 putative lipid II flippase FtsW [Ochrobactrum sp. S45]MBK0041869.1 putative lipid II flippase FtsW [Ochrobactrum sp. S46]MBO1023499.1 putative lipid II flippase FtsW [Ochrobactrum sp. SD129]MQP39131.1 putative lipid II flippase FtsW [Ochrobactrum sp. MYb237]